MSGLRGFLIGIANTLLFVVVVVVPIGAFAIAGSTAAGPFGGLRSDAAVAAAIAAFVVVLPAAAVLALFLDIREQLVALNHVLSRGVAPRGGPDDPRASPVQAAAFDHRAPTVARAAAAAPNDDWALSDTEDMQRWFAQAKGIAITPGEARSLLVARSTGNFLTAVEALVAARRQA